MLQNVRKITEKVNKSRYVGKMFVFGGKLRYAGEIFVFSAEKLYRDKIFVYQENL